MTSAPAPAINLDGLADPCPGRFLHSSVHGNAARSPDQSTNDSHPISHRLKGDPCSNVLPCLLFGRLVQILRIDNVDPLTHTQPLLPVCLSHTEPPILLGAAVSSSIRVNILQASSNGTAISSITRCMTA